MEAEVTSMRREGICSVSAELRAPCEDRGLENTPLTVKAEEELTEVRVKEAKEARLLKKVTILSVFWQRGLIRKGLKGRLQFHFQERKRKL